MGFSDFWINNNGKKEQLNNGKHGVRKEQVDKKFHNLFDAYDTNGDGTLENDELSGIFKGLTKFAGADKTLDSDENKQVSSLFENQAGIKDADFMGFVRSVSKATEDIVDSKETPTADGGREVTTTYKDGSIETISYYPDGEYKFKKLDQKATTTTNFYTIGNDVNKKYTAAEIENRVKEAYNQRVAQVKANAEKNKPIEGKATYIIPNYDQFKQEYMQRNRINQGSDTHNFERHEFELSERGKVDVAVRDFVLSHYIDTHKAAQEALESMGILDKAGTAINARAGELWNSIKNVWNGTDEEYQNFYELSKKFEPNYNKVLKTGSSLDVMRNNPEMFFREFETDFKKDMGHQYNLENSVQFQQTAEQYQNATLLKARIDILKDAMLEISMYENEQNALTYAPAQSEGMNPASHISKANNLLLQYFDGDKEAVNMLLNGSIGNAQSTINTIKGIADDTQKMFDAVTNGKSFDEIKNDYQTQYKAIYGTDFVPDELTEKVMDAKSTGGMVKLAAITAISVLITKSPIMTQMMGAAAGSVEATGAAANMIRTLTARYGATAVQQGIKFAMISGTLATDVGLTLLNQATSERGVDGQELWESTKGSAKYIYFGAYIGAPLAQKVSQQLGKIGATAKMFEGGVKSANGAIQTTSITGDKLVQNLMKGGNKVLTTGGAFLTDVAAFSALEVATEGIDPLTAGKEQTEMLGKLKIMNHFIEYMLGGKVHAGMSKAQMDATIERSGVKNWQIKEVKAPNKTVYEVEVGEGLPPMRFEDKNQLATAMLERVTANYSESAKPQTRTQTTKPEGEVKATPETEITTETARPESRINIPAGKFEAPNAKFAETDEAFRSIVTKRSADIKELDNITLLGSKQENSDAPAKQGVFNTEPTSNIKHKKVQLSARQQKMYDDYHADVKREISNTLSGDNLERANRLYDILQDHIVMVRDDYRSYRPKVEASDIIEMSKNPNIDFARLENIVKHLDPNEEINLGHILRRVMELSKEDFSQISEKLGEYSNDIRVLSSTTQIKSPNFDRIKIFLDETKLAKKKSTNNIVYSLKAVSELSDEAWNNLEQRGLFAKLSEIKPSSYDATLKSLANMDENTWTKVNERNLLKKNALRHIDVLSMLTDAEFKKLIDLKAYNDETGELRVADKFVGEFLQLSPEQEQKLNDYDLLNRDSSQSTIKGPRGSVNAAQVLTILKMSEGDFQKLIDKNLFNIQINGRKLNTDEIIILGNQEPSAINKVMDIMSFNNKIKVKEALSISELSNENIAKIKKYNLFEEKVAPRLFSHDIDGDIVLMLSAFKAAKNGDNTEMVNLRPAEIVKIAQMPESAIPKMLELLRNKNVEKYSFDDLMKIAKLDDAEFKKVLSIVDETKDDGHALLSYSLTENGDNARFNNVAYEQVRRFNEILDDPAHADIFIRYCQKSDGTHDAVIAERLIKALKNIGDIRLVSEVASIAKENNSGEFDIRFIDALEEAKSRGVSLSAFDLSLKECTDADGKFSQEIYNKIYELRASEIWEGGIPQILKVCKNVDGSFNNEVFQHAFKLKAMEHDNGRIGFILQAARDLEGNFNPKLLEEIHLEIYKWSASEFPKIINACLTDKGTIDRAVYDNLLKLLGSGRVQESDIIRIAPLFNGLSEYLGKNNINELSISEKRALLKKLVQFNALLFDRQFGIAMKECLKIDTRLIPLSKDEYCALLPKLVKSIGIDTKPLSSEVTARYQSAMDRLSEPNGALVKTDFNSKNIHLELEYPREQFINQMIKLLNDLPPLERMKATDYFGFEIIDRWDGVAQMNGYPINVNNGAKMAEISDPATKVVIEKMRPFVDKFTNQNKITIKDNPTLADELNDIVKAFPEFLTTIGRKQHGTHDFTIDIHTLKVLQGVITNPKFQQLSPADQRILQIATLMHDLTKAEGLVDKTHPQYSAYDTYYLLEKTNLSEAEKLKVYQLIKNHDWLERYNKAGTRAEAVARDIAFDLREGKLFEMASILAEADLKGVKANDTFYLRFQPALEKGNSKIRELVNDIQRTSIFLPQTKIPKASEIKIVGDKVKQETTKDANGNPITNTVIYLDKDMDLSAIGFADGLKGKDLNVLVHALDYENQSAVFQALGQVDSDALLSSSYITYNKGNYHVFRTQGFILDVAGTDIHAGTYMDFGSGCGKDMQTLKSQYLFNGDRKIIRNFFSDTLKDMLKLSDAEYQKLYEEIGDKTITELDKTHPNIAAKLREMFDSMEVHKRSHGRDYNEILISRPQIQSVFWQGKIKDSDALKHSTKKYTIDRVPEFLRKYAEDNNLPIIYFGE